MEMGRKFLLVGLYVTVQPGSIMQIAIGTITAAVYLMVQLQAQPYRNQSDNYLAVASSFCSCESCASSARRCTCRTSVFLGRK